MANASPTVTINTKEALAAFYAAQASGNITGLLSVGGESESPGFTQFESTTPQTKKESFFILDENNDDMVVLKVQRFLLLLRMNLQIQFSSLESLQLAGSSYDYFLLM